MMKILLIILTLLLVIGCSKPINYGLLVERDLVYYTKDKNKPYSGDMFSLDENGEIEEEVTLKDGLVWNGKWSRYYENGEKKNEVNYKDGKEDGTWTRWYENGQKYSEGIYGDGKWISEKCWNEDGNEKDCK